MQIGFGEWGEKQPVQGGTPTPVPPSPGRVDEHGWGVRAGVVPNTAVNSRTTRTSRKDRWTTQPRPNTKPVVTVPTEEYVAAVLPEEHGGVKPAAPDAPKVNWMAWLTVGATLLTLLK